MRNPMRNLSLRRSLRAVAVVGVLAVLAGACSSDANPASDDDTPTEAADDNDENGGDDDGGEGGESEEPAAVELEDTVVVAGSGGDLGAAYQEALSGWAEENGVNIQWIEGLATDHTGRIVSQKNNPEIDLFQGELVSHFAAAEQDVWQPLDTSIVTNLESYPDTGKLEDGTAILPAVDAIVIWWNEDEFEANGLTPPESWDDFWALLEEPALEDHVTMPAIDNGYMRSFVAVQLDDASDPTPVYDRLAEYDSRVYEYPRAPAAMFDLAASGQAWLGVNGFTRTLDMIDAGLPIAYVVPEGSPVTPLSWSFVKGAPHPNAAQSLVNYLLSDEGQQAVAQATGYSPILPGVEMEGDGFFTEEELGNLTDWDYQTVQQNLEQWRTLFAEIVREPASE